MRLIGLTLLDLAEALWLRNGTGCRFGFPGLWVVVKHCRRRRAVDDALRAAIAEVQQLAASAQPAPFAAAQAARIVAQRPDAAILALWLADAVLAARLKWPRPLPLIAGALMHPSLRSGGHRPYPGDADWTRSCCVAYGRAAAQACDLFAELARSSQKLIAVAPRLRARGAGAVTTTSGTMVRLNDPRWSASIQNSRYRLWKHRA